MARKKEYLLKDLHLCYLVYYNQDSYFEEDGPVMSDLFSDAGVAVCEKVSNCFRQVSTGKIFYLYDMVPTIGDYFVHRCHSFLSLIKPNRIIEVLDKKFTKEQIVAFERKFIQDYLASKYGDKNADLNKETNKDSGNDSNWKDKISDDNVFGNTQTDAKLTDEKNNNKKIDDQKEDDGLEF